MRYHVYTDARYIDGAVATDRTLTVYGSYSGGVASTLYTTRTGATTTDNPVTVPATGVIDFWIADPEPWVVAEGDSVRRLLPVLPSENGPPFYNVKDYGATANGSTDDTAAIQAAIDDLSAGDTLYFPSGVYLTSSPLRVTKILHLVGSDEKLTTIKQVDAGSFSGHFMLCNWNAADDPAAQYPPDSAPAGSTPYPRIEHLRFEVHQADTTCIGWHDFHEASYIRDVHFSCLANNATGINAIAISGGIQGGEIRRLCHMSGPYNYLLWVGGVGGGGTDLEVCGCTSSNNESGASLWYFKALNDLHFHDNHIEGYPDQDGATTGTIELESCGATSITNCYFGTPSLRPLVYATSCWGLTIDDCEIGNCYQGGDSTALVTYDNRTLAMVDYPASKIVHMDDQEFVFRQGIGGLSSPTTRSEQVSRYVFSGNAYTGVNPNVSHYRGFGTAAPTSLDWAVGDIVMNTAPSPGGYMGWVCTTAGTAGSDAVFKGFGAIEA